MLVHSIRLPCGSLWSRVDQSWTAESTLLTPTPTFLCHIYQSCICVYKAARATTHTNIHNFSADTSVSVYITKNMETTLLLRGKESVRAAVTPSLFSHRAFWLFFFSLSFLFSCTGQHTDMSVMTGNSVVTYSSNVPTCAVAVGSVWQLTFEFKILTFYQGVLIGPIIVKSVAGCALQD